MKEENHYALVSDVFELQNNILALDWLLENQGLKIKFSYLYLNCDRYTDSQNLEVIIVDVELQTLRPVWPSSVHWFVSR